MARYIYTPEASNEEGSSQETHTVDGEVQVEWPDIYTPESSNEEGSIQETHTVDGEVQVEWPGMSTHLSPAMSRAAARRPTQWMVKYR
jgi:hypothetical protein